MTPFFVQIKCELGKAYQVANELAEAEIASEIYSTAGDYDLLVKFYVDAGTDIGHFVNEKVQCIARHQGHPHHHHLQGVHGLNFRPARPFGFARALQTELAFAPDHEQPGAGDDGRHRHRPARSAIRRTPNSRAAAPTASRNSRTAPPPKRWRGGSFRSEKYARCRRTRPSTISMTQFRRRSACARRTAASPRRRAR